MEIVVDTNIVFSSLTRSRRVQEILISLYVHGHRVHSVGELVEELGGHLDRLARYSPLPRELLGEIVWELLPRIITLHSASEIPEPVRVRARGLVGGVDPDDWPFVALSMYLGVPLWTGDRGLLELSARTGFGHFTAVDTRGVEMLLEGAPWGRVEEYLRKRYQPQI